jgi:hypothetical protein
MAKDTAASYVEAAIARAVEFVKSGMSPSDAAQSALNRRHADELRALIAEEVAPKSKK